MASMSVSTWDEIVDSPKCLCTALGGVRSSRYKEYFLSKKEVCGASFPGHFLTVPGRVCLGQ